METKPTKLTKSIDSKDLGEINIKVPRHVAIILDGNGRWAKENGHTRNYGHRKGCDNLVEICKGARKKNIKFLTVYAFSTENWSRPKDEVNYLMNLAKTYLNKYLGELVKNNVHVNVIGRRDNLDDDLLEVIDKVESSTKNCFGNCLNIAFNYGSHEEITQAVKAICSKVQKKELKLEDINENIIESMLYTKDIPPVDLLIRTSGEERVSNFLLWQLAYSEFYFSKVYWPDFKQEDFDEAIKVYSSRKRRFGGLK